MKSAYELAMERLNKSSPSVKLTAAQKAEIADLESKSKAKIAEREIAIQSEVAHAVDKGDAELMHKLEQQIVQERKKILAEFEEKKLRVRERPAR